MDELNQQQSNTVTRKNPSTEQRQGLAVASLVLGILSIVLSVTVIFSFTLGTLAIIFGALSTRSTKKGMAIAGIITSILGILLTIIIVPVGIAIASSTHKNDASVRQTISTYQSASDNTITNDPSDSQSASDDSITNDQSDIQNASDESITNDRMETYYGDGFELRYNNILWHYTTFALDNSDETMPALRYTLDNTALMIAGVSDMYNYSTKTSTERDAIYSIFYELFNISKGENSYIVGGTDTLEVLKDDIYYASYCLYGEDDALKSKTYMVVSESDNTIVVFSVRTGLITKNDPDIMIMPVLSSITFTGRPASADSVKQEVKESEDEYTIGDDTIPSLSKIMTERNISFTYNEGEKTIGKMRVPSILNYTETPDLVPVEIMEITYSNVDDVISAINTYGRLLYENYDFRVTYTPTECPDYGEGYRFCELVKGRGNGEAGVIYVAAVYNHDEKIIKLQFGTIGESSILDSGLGPLKLEAIRQAGLSN